MKKLIYLILFIPGPLYAAAPTIYCPSGFVAVNEAYLTIAGDVCPPGTTSVGIAKSCLVSTPSGTCIMYAPTNTTYTDSTGSYEFTEICPLN